MTRRNIVGKIRRFGVYFWSHHQAWGKGRKDIPKRRIFPTILDRVIIQKSYSRNITFFGRSHLVVFYNNTVIYSVNNTIYRMLVINIKNLVTFFSSLNHPQANYQNTVLAECTSTMFWELTWGWFSEPKHVAKFLILITNICQYMLDRLCGLVVRVSGYRYRDLGFDSQRYQIFWVVVGLERGPLSLVRSIEELRE